MENTEQVYTTEVRCFGDDNWGGHPTVFYTIDPKIGEVTCMYCNKKFIYNKKEE
ncbi:zinc-finger domain-containing protein [bacterium]|nr:zinc-finger domain-containing protein [Candidatus Elulimicrobium humile]